MSREDNNAMHAWEHNLEALRRSLGTMPEGPYRSYCTWILDHPSLAERWFQVSGMTQLVRMTNLLLDDVLSADEVDAVLPYSALMNVGHVYEVISDDLAIGLAVRRPQDETFTARSAVLRAFGDAMMRRLSGAPAAETRRLLLALEGTAAGVSSFAQSTDGPERRTLAAAYCADHPHAGDVEHAVIPSLIANVEANAALQDALSTCAIEPLFRHGLIRRYRAVDALLARSPASMAHRLQLGADAIMVVPTLAYYVGLVAERVHHVSGYGAVLADGHLRIVFERAALLVRVLNDAGTALLEQSNDERRALHADLLAVARQRPRHTLADVLIGAADTAPALTRLRKDIVYGKFNVCLDGLREQEASPDIVAAFVARLSALATTYTSRCAALRAACALLAQRLGAPVLSDIVLRFVDLHRAAYAQPFDAPNGGYAVPSTAVGAAP